MKTDRFMAFDAKGVYTGVSDSNFNNIVEYADNQNQVIIITEFINFDSEVVRYISNPNDEILNYLQHPKALEAIDKFNIKPNHHPMFELIPELSFN